MKPAGIDIAVSDGALVFRVSPSDRVADKIWEAVQDAVCANWTPEQLKREFAAAWEHEHTELAKQGAKILSR